MRILLIEDEPRIRAFIVPGLGAEAFTVDERERRPVGLRRALDQQYDLVILDMGLPSMDGLSVLRALGRERTQLPVLMLSAGADIRTRPAAFSLGACDYLDEPFAFDELLARVHTQLKRSAETADETSVR